MMIECKMCGHKFDIVRSEHYIARGEGKCGLSALAGGDECKIYDAFDCPICGCQIIVQERKRVYVLKEDENSGEE